MNKDLTLTGITLTPYSDVSPDGQLSVLHNLENYNGSIRPSLITGTTFNVDGKILYLHATNQYRHIIYDDERGSICYYDEASKSTGKVYDTNDTINSISHVGNVLVIMADDKAPQYIMWTNNEYQYLGCIPELHCRFKLQSQLTAEDWTDWPNDWGNNGSPNNPADDNERMKRYNYAAASVSNYIEKQCNEKGRFVFPFYVRAAYRTTDGKHIMHTPPVLMIPNSYGPYVSVQHADHIVAFAFSSKLVVDIKPIDKEWASLITGVDIFVTPALDPFRYEYDSNNPDLIDEYNEISSQNIQCIHENFGIGMLSSDDSSLSFNLQVTTGKFAQSVLGTGMSLNTNYGQYHMERTTGGRMNLFTLAKKKDDAISFDAQSNFYFIKRFSLSELASMQASQGYVSNDIILPNGYYNNLVFKETLDDDYQSHDIISTQYSHVYNGRLAMVSTDVTHFVCHPFDELFAYQNADTISNNIHMFALTSRNGIEYWHLIGHTNCRGYIRSINHLFSPSLGIREVAFRFDKKSNDPHTDQVYSYRRFKLTEHKLLTGMQLFKDWTDGSYYNLLTDNVYDDPIDTYETIIDGKSSDVEHLSNVLRVSRTNNPLSFPAEGEIVIGNTGIMAMSSITEALSTGQFGGYPLMVFCKDGNYALRVLDSGWYGDVRPMKRDVCINAASVTPIDGAIIFTSRQGVMIFDGNQVNCISRDLLGVAPKFVRDNMPESLSDVKFDLAAPMRFLDKCLYAWDYASQRLICVVPGKTIAFVRNMQDGLWSSMSINSVMNVINSYPNCYIQEFDLGKVTKLDNVMSFDDSSESTEGLIITRPIKCDTLQFKKLMQFSVQGIFREYQNVSLYGSNDCKEWSCIGSTNSRRVERIAGRWVKYIRFVIKTDLNESENISAIRLVYDVRNESQIR